MDDAARTMEKLGASAAWRKYRRMYPMGWTGVTREGTPIFYKQTGNHTSDEYFTICDDEKYLFALRTVVGVLQIGFRDLRTVAPFTHCT